MQGLHLVLERDRGELVPDRPVPVRPAAAGAPTVRLDHGVALVGDPLGLQPALRAVHDLAVVRAAVRAHQDRQGGARHVVPGQHDAHREVVGADPVEGGPGQRRRRLGVRRHRAGLVPAAVDRHHGGGLAGGDAGDDHRAAGDRADVHAARPGQPLDAGTGRPPPQVLLRRVVGAEDQDAVVADGQHRVDLDRGVGDRLAVDHEPAGPVEVGGRHQATVGQQGRHAGHDVQPHRVRLREQQRGRPGGRVDRADLGPALVARHHLHDRSGRRPGGGGEVGEGGEVPGDVGAAAVEAQDVQRHVGLGAAGHGVAHLGGRRRRVGGVGDVPPLHRALVDPGGEDRVAAGGPPVAAVAAHLLGGHELGHAPRDVRLLGRREGARARPVGAHDVQAAVGRVGDPAAGRVGARIDDRADRRQLAHRRVGAPRSASHSRLERAKAATVASRSVA